MRRAAPYFLFAVILAIVGFVWFSYQQQLSVQKRNTATPPQPLPSTLNSKAQGFVYATSEGNRTVAELRAKDYREVKNPAHMELDQMELRLFHADGKSFDLVKAAKGDFYPAENRLSSQSEVEVQMAVPAEGIPAGKILAIKAQGASLEIKTGKMLSGGLVEFRFHQEGGEGTGHATGAEYDPQLHELHLLHKSILKWQPKNSTQQPIEVESDEVRYLEKDSKVLLSPWSKMRKADFSLEAATSEVLLEKGVIRHVLALDARGSDKTPKRQVDYAAKTLNVDFTSQGHVEKVIAEDDARLNTRGDNGKTNTTARRIDLFFQVSEKESVLDKALANGKAVIESIPVSKGGVPVGETKILRSESIEMKMRKGGEEIENVQVHAPGTIDFLPNRPTQRKRHMEGERMTIQYAAANQIEIFRSVNVTTRTDPDPDPKAKKGSQPIITSSKDLEARFDPKTGELVRLEQWNDFRYQEGDRRASSERAVQENAANRITLTGKARVWDLTGSTDANEIVLNQTTGEFAANGKVRSIREAEKTAKSAKPAEVTQATADRMEMRESNTKIRYEGNAVMWQGENRLRAPRIDIDRKLGQLRATGGIVHQMIDDKSAQAKKTGVILTNVKSADMAYADKERLVEYHGNVVMTRPGLEVKSAHLRAYLDEDDAERFNEQPSGGIEKAFASGAVTIVETGTQRVRKGNGETGEFYTADSKLVLEGGKPEMVDFVKGVEQRRTTGRQLTWFANSDKLIVDGEAKKPSQSTLQRKR